MSSRSYAAANVLQYNTEGLGYAQNGNPNPLGGPNREKYLKVAKQMTRMWISFANFGDPNMNLGGECSLYPSSGATVVRKEITDSQLTVESQHWPVYTLDAPQNFVFEQNVSSHPEPDTFRAEGIKYLSNLILARAGKQCESLVACGVSNVGDEIYLEE